MEKSNFPPEKQDSILGEPAGIIEKSNIKKVKKKIEKWTIRMQGLKSLVTEKGALSAELPAEFFRRSFLWGAEEKARQKEIRW